MQLALTIPNYLKPVEVQSPLDVYKQRLQSASLQQQQQQVSEAAMRLKQAQAKPAALQILEENGGDIEKSIPQLMQVAPDLGIYYAQILQRMKAQQAQQEMNARTAALQNQHLQEGALLQLKVPGQWKGSGRDFHFEPDEPNRPLGRRNVYSF